MTVFDDILSAGFGAMVPGGGFDVKAAKVDVVALTALASIVDAATAQTAMGSGAPAPVTLLRGDEPTAVTDLIGSDNLTAVGSPTRQHVNADFNITTVQITDGSGTESLDAANSTVFDPGVTPFAWVHIASDVVSSSGVRLLYGKRETGGDFLGFEVQYQAGSNQVTAVFDTASGAVTRAVVGVPKVVLVAFDGPGNITRLQTSAGETVGGANNESITTDATGIFAIGDARQNATGQDWGASLFFLTAIPTNVHFTNLETFLSL